MCSNAHREPKWHPPVELHRKQILEAGRPEACAAALVAEIVDGLEEEASAPAGPGLRSSSALWAKVQRSP